MQQIHLIISGDVQGVGFRAWAKREAQKLNLTGWVKNREDKTVEIIAQGKKIELKKMIELCRQGPEVAWVKDMQVAWQEATNEFVEFVVVF